MTQWKELSTNERLKLVVECWNPDFSTTGLAAAVSARLEGESISRNVIIGIYNRYPNIRHSYPLGSVRHRMNGESGQGPVVARARRKRTNISLFNGGGRASHDGPPPMKTSKVKKLPSHQLFDDTETLKLTLEQLSHDQCHFPVNDAAVGEAHLFCGLPVKAGKSYCPHHFGRCTIG